MYVKSKYTFNLLYKKIEVTNEITFIISEKSLTVISAF